VHDALKRRCLYYWIDYPDFQKEFTIVRAKAPDLEPMLVKHITAFVQEMRRMELFKAPGIVETLDWTSAIIALDQQALSLEVIADARGVILKYQDDIKTFTPETLSAIHQRAQVQADLADR
jgi:MoxR-like ATPase